MIQLLFRMLVFAAVMAPGATVAQQTSGAVTGRVLNNQSQPVVNATVILYAASDSALVKAEVSDSTGMYEFTGIAYGRYYLVISHVGYASSSLPVFELQSSAAQMPETRMSGQLNTQETVTITGRKPFIERRLDRTVINVEASVTAAGGTAMEVLEKSPGVMVDKDGNITLRGKPGVTVYVDGRPAYLSGSDLAAFLRNMPADQLERIEVITNPSSMYDAAGNGVIELRTKKIKSTGLSGSLTSAYIQGRYAGTTHNLTVNYRKDRLNMFGNLGFAMRNSFDEYDILRNIKNTNGALLTIYDQASFMKYKNRNFNARFGMDYAFSKKTSAGVLVSGYHNPSSSGMTNTTMLKNPDNSTRLRVEAPANAENEWNNISVNANVKHKTGSGAEISASGDYIRYKAQSDQFFSNFFLNNDGSTAAPANVFSIDLPRSITISGARADYTKSLGQNSQIQAGVKYSQVETDNNSQFYNQLAGGWRKNDSLSNHFIYTEKISAGYLNYKQQLKKWELLLGIRAENTRQDGNQLTTKQTFSRNFTQLFPSAFIAYKPGEKTQYALSYSRRILRPDFRDLNPFRFYIDQYTYEEGNPFLRPQLSHNIELTQSLMEGALTTTLSYSTISQPIQDVVLQNPVQNETFQRPENLSNRRTAGMSVDLQLPLADNINSTLHLEYNYNEIKGQISNQRFFLNANTFSGNLLNQVKFGRGWTVELMGQYTSRTVDGTFTFAPMGLVAAGISKLVLKKKATVRLSANDIFFTNRYRGTSLYQNIDVSLLNRFQSRAVKLTFTWRFKKGVKLEQKPDAGKTPEEQRVTDAGGNKQ